MNLHAVLDIVRGASARWWEDNVPRLSASLAFYTIFSLAPVLFLVVSFAGLIFGEQAARGELVNRIRDFIGEKGALLVQTLILSAGRRRPGIVPSLIALGMFLIGASGAFVELKASLNAIWKTQSKKSNSLLEWIKSRLLSFAMIIGIGILLMLSVVASAVLSVISSYMQALPGFYFLFRTGDLLISFFLITLLFALIFKLLPDARIAWHDVWVGALLTSFLFTTGKYLISIYLGRSSAASAYGAASSLAVLLFWIYYSAQVFFFGTELTCVYAERYGSHVALRDESLRGQRGDLPRDHEANAGPHRPFTAS